MKLYDELQESVNDIIDIVDESSEFKSRFAKLISNYFNQSYTDSDILGLIDTIEAREDL